MNESKVAEYFEKTNGVSWKSGRTLSNESDLMFEVRLWNFESPLKRLKIITGEGLTLYEIVLGI